MMASLDYLNARARGLKGRLLSAARLRELARLDGVPAFVGALLTGGPYARHLDAAGGIVAGLAACERAILERLSTTLARLRKGVEEPYVSWLALSIAPWDVANVKRILRGWRTQASLEELAREWLPLGALSMKDLRAFAETASVAGLASRLEAWSGLGQALGRVLRESQETARAMEDRLDLAWAEYVSSDVEARTDAARTFRAFFEWQIDVVNVRSALRAAREGGRERGIFLPGGRRFSDDRWASVSRRANLQEAYAALEGTPFADAARAETPPFEASSSLGRVGERLQGVALSRMLHVYRTCDPLGLAGPLWYAELLTNEARNLRKILHGLQHRLPKGLIEEELVFV